MPKIYNDETLAMVWQAIDTEKRTLRSIAVELGVSMSHINRMYEAAAKRFKNKQERTSKPQQKRNAPTVKVQRPPAEYSNSSPYRIARPGINR